IFRNSPLDGSAACAVSPLGIRYCVPTSMETRFGPVTYSANNAPAVDALVWQAQLAIAGFGAAVSLLGVCLLAALIGAVFASALNNLYGALALSFIVSLALGYGLIAVVYPELVICAEIDLHVLHILLMLAYSTFYAVLPFALAVIGIKAAEAWS